MKRIKQLIISLLFFCVHIYAQDAIFVLDGTIPEKYNEKEVMLFTFFKGSIHSVDTTIIKNGQFSFTGKEHLLDESIVTTGNYPETVKSCSLFLEKGMIHVCLSDTAPHIAYGTFLNDVMNTYYDSLYLLGKKIDQVEMDLYKDKIDANEANTQKWELTKERYRLNAEFKRKNIKNIAGKTIFIKRLNEALTDPYFDEIYALIDDELKAHPEVVGAVKEKEEHKKQEKLRTRSIGQDYVDFEFETPEKKTVSFSEYVGQSDILIIDFWASWCGPCIAEIPNLKEVYEKYKDRISILSVSIDSNKQQWLSSLEKQEMPWPQLLAKPEIHELLKEKYHFSGIPHIILLDKTGKIVQVNLRGAFLDKFIEISL